MPKFVPRQRKHKAIARQNAKPKHVPTDTNTAEILPWEQRDRADKKSALKQELLGQSQGKISGKKKKRLDKYIVRVQTAWIEQHFMDNIAKPSRLLSTLTFNPGNKAQEGGESRTLEEASCAKSRH